MSYHVNKRKRKDGTVGWRLLRSEWKDGKVKYEHIPNGQLIQHGLSPDMSLEDARARVKQLNALVRADKEAESAKARSLKQHRSRETLKCAHLPLKFVEEFEEQYLRVEMERGTRPEENYKKALFHWELAKKLIVEANLPQDKWFTYRRRFYTLFVKREISLSYAGKVLRVLNLWGLFIADKTGSSFIPIPHPTGVDREAIKDAHLESDKKKKDSLPLTPELLEQARGKLSEPHYNWLFVSLWFGLRGHEVGAKWKEVVEPEGTVLMVYQSKLTGIDHSKRWKRIPVKYPEQEHALMLLREKKIKRPLVKTIQRALGEGYNSHAGRKGFTRLMEKLGEPFDAVSEWLGHSTLNRTYEDYVDKTKTKWGKTG